MTRTLAVAVAVLLGACGGPDADVEPAPAADPVAAPEVTCEERWLQNVPQDDGSYCSFGTITVRYCQRQHPPEPPPEFCAAWR
jgi:hypothetical protein